MVSIDLQDGSSPTKVAATGSSSAFVSWNGLSTTLHTRPSHAMYPTPQWPKSTATLAEFVVLGPSSTTVDLSVVEPVDEDDEPSRVAVEACTTPAGELSRHPLRGLNNSRTSSAIGPLAVPSLAINATSAGCPFQRLGASTPIGRSGAGGTRSTRAAKWSCADHSTPACGSAIA